MGRASALCLALLLSAPAAAQERPADDISRGADLMAEGAMRLLRGLAGAVEPELRGLARRLEEWGGPGAYAPPEVLPNGDIIIRRRRGPPGPGETDV